MQDALTSYVVRREANGTVVIYWYNAEFLSVARRRYLTVESQRVRIHSMLAHYFIGTWGGGRRKPFKYSRKQLMYMSQKRNPQRRRTFEDESADRMVPKQPLQFGPDPRYPGRLNYNLRKLSELPHHLLESGMISELKSLVIKLITKLNVSFISDLESVDVIVLYMLPFGDRRLPVCYSPLVRAPAPENGCLFIFPGRAHISLAKAFMSRVSFRLFPIHCLRRESATLKLSDVMSQNKSLKRLCVKLKFYCKLFQKIFRILSIGRCFPYFGLKVPRFLAC